MAWLRPKIIGKVVQANLVGFILWTIVTPAWAQEKIRISYSPLSPNVGVLWIAHAEGSCLWFGCGSRDPLAIAR